MMKNLLTIAFAMLTSFSLFAQELDADDRVNITQSSKPFIGVYTFGYQGLPTPGYPQFQLNNYGGVPGTPLATEDNSILGMFAFSGHNGSAKKTVGVIRVKSMDNFAAALSSRMDFLIGPNREQRMTILGSNGYVGIGGEPTAKLHIHASGTSANDGIKMTTLDDTRNWYMYMNDSNDFQFQENAKQIMTFQSGTGFVGLGTDSPNHALDIKKEGTFATMGITGDNGNNTNIAGVSIRTNEDQNDEFTIRKYGSDLAWTMNNGLPFADMSVIATANNAGALYMGTNSNSPLYLASNGEVGLYMATDQDIGINTQIPAANLHVVETESVNQPVIYGENEFIGNLNKVAVEGRSINNPGYGFGGSFQGGSRGVFGSAAATDYPFEAYGVHGYATGTAGDRIGVMGHAYNENGLTSYGTYGIASGTAEYNYGVYGTASGATTKNWAGYFEGNTYVHDTLEVNNRVYINNDESRTERLVVEDEVFGNAVYIKNEGDPSTSVATGFGMQIDAGLVGISVDVNEQDLDGNSYGYYMYNLIGGTELTGSQYGMYAYTSGSRTASGGNYSMYALQGGTAGLGTNWAGYFSGNVRVTGTLDNTSDARLKKDIKDMNNALDIIDQLQPKTYSFRTDEYPHMMLDERPQLGFVAQDVEKILPQLVRTAIHPEHINQEGEESDIPNSPAVDVKSINYIGIIPVLTQGIKELTLEIEEKDDKIEEMSSQISLMTKKMEDMAEMMTTMNEKFNQMEEDMSSCCLDGLDSRTGVSNTDIELNGSDMATLEQNAPNPFTEQTMIKYYIPSFAQKASLTITDIKGTLLKSANIKETGLGTVAINANELPIGTYIYTLYVDGQKVESKQMVLVK